MVRLNPRAPVLIAWSLILLFIATSAVILRVTSTRMRHRQFKGHDYLVFFSLVSLNRPETLRILTQSPGCLDWICDRCTDW
jgi:hypothetical protein